MIVTQGRSLVPLGAWTRSVLTGGRRNGLWWTDVIVCVFLDFLEGRVRMETEVCLSCRSARCAAK